MCFRAILIFVGLIFGGIPLTACAETLGKLSVSLQISNLDMPEFGFIDGHIPTLSAILGGQTVATYINIEQSNVVFEATSESHIFRLKFEKALVLKLANGVSGKFVASRLLPFIDVDMGDQADNLRNILMIPRQSAVVGIDGDIQDASEQFLAKVKEIGIEGVGDGDLELPRVYRYSKMSIAITLGSLRQLSPVVPTAIRSSYIRVDAPEGRVNSGSTSISGVKVTMAAPLRSKRIQDLLTNTI